MCLPYCTEGGPRSFRIMHVNSDSLITLYLVKTAVLPSPLLKEEFLSAQLSCPAD
jgi:hypothetical protein